MTQIADRRVRRTRRNLAEALVGLILERGYERVTVQDILDRADVGRSTFYAHFRDKEALLLSCFDGLGEELARDLDEMTPGRMPQDPAQPSLAIFSHASRHRKVYRALCGRQGGPVVQRHLHDLLAGLVTTHLAPHLATPEARVPAPVVTEHYVSALLGVLTWWVRQDFPYQPAEMARMFGLLANPGVMTAIGRLPYPEPNQSLP